MVRCTGFILPTVGFLIVGICVHTSTSFGQSAGFEGDFTRSEGSYRVAEEKKKAYPKPAPKAAPKAKAVTQPKPVAKPTPKATTRPKPVAKPAPKVMTQPKPVAKPVPKATPKIVPKALPKPVPKSFPKSTPTTPVVPKDDPTKKGPVIGPTKKGPISDPIKKGPAVGPIKKGPVVDPAKKTGPIVGPGKKTGPVADPTKKGPVVDPTKKTGPIAGPGKKTGPVGDPTKKKTGPIAGPGKKTPPVGTTKKPGPKGPKGQPGVNVSIINKKGVPIFRGGRTIRIGSNVRRIVAISTLAAIAIGAASYYPYGYAAMSRPVCQGITAEGCALRWQSVPTEEGDMVYQCVQYCPQGYLESPYPVVTAPPVRPPVQPSPPELSVPSTPDIAQPVVASGACDIVIYSEPQFGGISSETTEDQPDLEEVGWAQEIASIEIKAGTWDLFSEGQYGGETVRLEVGSYPTLPPDWSNRISSFMCSDPSE